MTKNRVLCYVVLPIGFFLAACTGLKSSLPGPDFYLLHPAAVEQAAHPDHPVSISVEMPEVSAGLDTDKIALFKNNGRQLDYFSGVRWNGALDDILQDFIIRTFEASYSVAAVEGNGLHQKADYKITTKIRDFQAEYGSDLNALPLLRVGIVMAAVKLPEEETVARVRLEKTFRAEENGMSAIVSGFEKALQEILREALNEIGRKI